MGLWLSALLVLSGVLVVGAAFVASPAQASVPSTFSFDWNDGTTQGWQAFGNGVPSNSTALVHSGAGALKCVAGNATGCKGPQFISGSQTADTTETITAWVYWPYSSGLSMCGSQVAVNAGTGCKALTTNAGAWTLVSQTFTIAAGATDWTPAITGNSAGTAFYLDDFSASAGPAAQTGPAVANSATPTPTPTPTPTATATTSPTPAPSSTAGTGTTTVVGGMDQATGNAILAVLLVGSTLLVMVVTVGVVSHLFG